MNGLGRDVVTYRSKCTIQMSGHFDHEFVSVFLNAHSNRKDNCLINFLIIYITPYFFNLKTHLESKISP